MAENQDIKKKEVKELAFNRDEIRKSLDRSSARDELNRKEEGERKDEQRDDSE